MRIPLFTLNYGVEEERALREVLRSRWISMGPRVQEFESGFAGAHGAAHGIAVANCTVALHVALRGLNVGPGDEVVVPSLTFVATAASVLAAGATPVFADIVSPDDWTMDPSDLERVITPSTKAIIPMHYGGHGADMVKICEIARQHNLIVIEDACHAPFGIRSGLRLGSLGHAACYSFYSNKNLSTGEGGMVITSDDELAVRLRRLRSHGLTTSAYERHMGREFYDVVEYGYNYRMDDIHAALGLVQMRKWPKEAASRVRVVNRYRRNLLGQPDIHVPFASHDGSPGLHIFGVLIGDGKRNRVRQRLAEQEIETSMHYPPVHQFACFRTYARKLPVTEEVGAAELSLPLHGRLTNAQIDEVCEKLLESLE
ncbi:MAG TPA: DegT/DnrJ/EryC1/StrS family aminotransferase [Verrucomicrobiota bacterium]|nr:DegT/DnrJ/EryC1/StrS family aminotransferase [Verrucomicrobiota bacterium]